MSAEQKHQTNFFTSNIPTNVTAEYSVRFSAITEDIPLLQEKYGQAAQVLVSHNQDFKIFQENECVEPLFTKFLMTGSTKGLKSELSEAREQGEVTDYVVSNEVWHNQVFDDHLMFQVKNPFVTFAARLGNSSSLLFAGISGLKLCSDGNEDLCDLWFENISSPLYMYTFEKQVPNDDHATSLCDVIKLASVAKDSSSNHPVGIIKFAINHDFTGISNETNNITATIEEDLGNFRKGNKTMGLTVILALVFLVIVLIFKMWTSKYQNYQRLDE